MILIFPKGLESQLEPCNSNACFGWSVWGPWSACTVSCGDGHQSRERNCGNPEEDENEIDDRSGVNMKSVIYFILVLFFLYQVTSLTYLVI